MLKVLRLSLSFIFLSCLCLGLNGLVLTTNAQTATPTHTATPTPSLTPTATPAFWSSVSATPEHDYDLCPNEYVDLDTVSAEWASQCSFCNEQYVTDNELQPELEGFTGLNPIPVFQMGSGFTVTPVPTNTPFVLPTSTLTLTPSPTSTPHVTCGGGYDWCLTYDLLADKYLSSFTTAEYSFGGSNPFNWAVGEGFRNANYTANSNRYGGISFRLYFPADVEVKYIRAYLTVVAGTRNELGVTHAIAGYDASSTLYLSQTYSIATVTNASYVWSGSAIVSRLDFHWMASSKSGTGSFANGAELGAVTLHSFEVFGNGVAPSGAPTSTPEATATAGPSPTASSTPVVTPTLIGNGIGINPPVLPSGVDCTEPEYVDYEENPIADFSDYGDLYVSTECFTVVPGIFIDPPDLLFGSEMESIILDQIDLCIEFYDFPVVNVLGIVIPLDFFLILPIAWLVRRLFNF